MINKRRKKGFSLAEFLVALGLFLILTSSLFGTLTVGIKYYKKSNVNLEAQRTAKNILDFIADEVRQAVPNPDPGIGGNPPTGYKNLTPIVNPTGVLYPNVNEPSTDYIVFTEPDYNYYDPTNIEWSFMDPRNYKKIRYFIQGGNSLVRQEILYNSNGAQASRSQTAIVEFPAGSITLLCTYNRISGSLPGYTIRVFVVDSDGKQISLSSSVTLPTDGF